MLFYIIPPKTMTGTLLTFLCPFLLTPEWGAMRTPKEWDRTYSQYTQSELVPVPPYDLKTLTTPMMSLIKPLKKENYPKITSKLYYSTRYMGTYDLDSGEYTGKHDGIDFKEPLNTPIRAVAAGKVTKALKNSTYGNHIVISSRYGYTALYGHMTGLDIKKGTNVKAGDIIGYVGMTGNTSGPHLHLGIYKRNKAVNPMSLLPYPCK